MNVFLSCIRQRQKSVQCVQSKFSRLVQSSVAKISFRIAFSHQFNNFEGNSCNSWPHADAFVHKNSLLLSISFPKTYSISNRSTIISTKPCVHYLIAAFSIRHSTSANPFRTLLLLFVTWFLYDRQWNAFYTLFEHINTQNWFSDRVFLNIFFYIIVFKCNSFSFLCYFSSNDATLFLTKIFLFLFKRKTFFFQNKFSSTFFNTQTKIHNFIPFIS